eukprot:g2430.t1
MNSIVRRTFSTYVIQGSSRGIGLSLVREIAERQELRKKTEPSGQGDRIFALCRDPRAERSKGLVELQQMYPSLITILPMDFNDELSIENAVRTVKELREKEEKGADQVAAKPTAWNRTVDCLINASGILHAIDEDKTSRPETALNKVKSEWLHKNFQINCVGPLLVTKHFAPLMTTPAKWRKRTMEEKTNDHQQPNRFCSAVVASISAKVGSISDNRLGGWYSYRISKAALNMAVKCSALELARSQISCIGLHPGTVETDLSEPFRKNISHEIFSTAKCAKMLLDVVHRESEKSVYENFANGNDIPGQLYDYEGRIIEP